MGSIAFFYILHSSFVLFFQCLHSERWYRNLIYGYMPWYLRKYSRPLFKISKERDWSSSTDYFMFQFWTEHIELKCTGRFRWQSQVNHAPVFRFGNDLSLVRDKSCWMYFPYFLQWVSTLKSSFTILWCGQITCVISQIN